MITRRQSLSLLAAAGAATASLPLLASCGPNSSPGGSDGSVRIYWWGGDLRLTLTQEALDLFRATDPGFEVADEFSEWTGYWDKLATQVAGGAPPDLLQMDEAYIDSYGNQGALADLESLSDVLDLSAMDENVLDTGRLADGTLVGAPLGVGIFSVGVNTDLLAESGVDVPADTEWTWEQMLEVCTEIGAWGKEQGVVALDFFGQSAAELGAWARQSGERVFPREDETLVSLDTIKAFLDYANRLIEAGAAPGASDQIEDFNAGVEQGRFGTGTSVFHFQFHTQVQTFQKASGATMDLLRLPALTAGDPQMVNKASMYWSIASASVDSGAAENAGILMDYLLTDPDAAKVLKIERGVTAIPAMQDAVEPELDDIETICLEFARTMQSEVVRAPLVTPASGVGFGEEVTRISQSYYFGDSDLDAAAQEILTALEGMQG
ncbi:ABC transporter substrate-binding protein [Brachybacterium sp. DNPG3]